MAEYIERTEELMLAMNAGARAIENTKRYHGAVYTKDLFSEISQEIPYLLAAKVLREASDAPAADVAPVWHGRWEWFDEDTGTPITGYEREWGWRCTHCKEELPDDYDDPDCRPKFRYCCNCGAKMDGGGEDG